MKQSEALEFALGWLQALGWRQEDYGTHDHQIGGPVCALGALRLTDEAIGGSPDAYLLRCEVWDVRGTDIVAFNDLPATTQRDVERLFTRVGKKLAKEGK